MPQRRYFVQPGDRFGRLVVEQAVEARKRNAADCVCDCGTRVRVLLQNLIPKTRSCGCLKRRGTMSDRFAATRGAPRKFTVEPGQRFGRLVALDEVQQTRPDGKKVWAARCQCDCGNEVVVLLHNLKVGRTQSCGCLQSERATASNQQRTDHGLSKHEHFPRWIDMLARCENPNNPRYPTWGGRGIKVCTEWHDVREFIAYLENVLGPRPKGHSLDRIDNDGNYEPGNIRWADVITQRHNQRRGTAWSSTPH